MNRVILKKAECRVYSRYAVIIFKGQWNMMMEQFKPRMYYIMYTYTVYKLSKTCYAINTLRWRVTTQRYIDWINFVVKMLINKVLTVA